MRCLRCALDYGPDERYCNRCGRALSRPIGHKGGEEGSELEATQDTAYLYSTFSPPGAAPTATPASPRTADLYTTPRAARKAPSPQSGSRAAAEPEEQALFSRSTRSALPGQATAPHTSPQETGLPDPYGAGGSDREFEAAPTDSGIKTTTIGLDAQSWRAVASGRISGPQIPRRAIIGGMAAAILVVVGVLALIRHNAYNDDLRAARQRALQQQYGAALSSYRQARSDWPFNQQATREQAQVAATATVVTAQATAAAGQAQAAATAQAERVAIYASRQQQRVQAAEENDVAALATATAVAQAQVATAEARATAAAQATTQARAADKARALATAYASATAQARASAATHPTPVAELPAGGAAGTVSLAHPLAYTAIGASDAVGVGADNPATQSWVADLYNKLPAGSRLTNLGKSGALLSYGVQTEVPAAIAANPDVITVWMVVNDINAQVPIATYRVELDTMLGTLRARTHAAIYVGNAPNLTLLPRYSAVNKQQLTAVIENFNAIIAEVARAHGATVVDLYGPSTRTLPSHPNYTSGDGFHPSTAGYADLANVWWDALHASAPG